MLFDNNTFLITGADGFIGSHLPEALVKEGAKVKALSYYNSFNSWGWVEGVNPQILLISKWRSMVSYYNEGIKVF